ncbi:hypothetical protein [Actibacterium sp. 188UL27-1]|uniref:hypothetical protein n=1 Tax=Actibacterium sp. 188UL27-1 TaxID=2786961 RepID=UPI00195F0461|nr:hypothetical protein [Actibacterium sp. 188UL27-1]MBM7066511.1 hypothetical protein [Actibacterium sp. 188UL27-1]
MPFAKTYTTFDVRRLMQNSEGAASPVTGAAAHARVLHAEQAGPGGPGTTPAQMMHRTHKRPGESNSQFKNRGGAVQTSAFKNVLQQSDAVAQALNSPRGQAVMRVFDRAATQGLPLRAMLKVGGIQEAGFLAASGAPKAKTVHKNDATVSSGTGAGVNIILDRGPNANTFVVQTCYPLTVCPASSYKVTDQASRAVIEQG